MGWRAAEKILFVALAMLRLALLANRRSFDYAYSDETAIGSAQDDTAKFIATYSSLPGRDMSSRMASLGLLL
jgi:hypothetical protein